MYIVHGETSRDYKDDRYACCENSPGPVRNLFIVRAPCHQESHRQVNQDITKSPRSELERLCAVEVSYCHTCYSKQDDSRPTGEDQHQAECGSDHKAAHTASEHLSCRHFVATGNRAGAQ